MCYIITSTNALIYFSNLNLSYNGLSVWHNWWRTVWMQTISYNWQAQISFKPLNSPFSFSSNIHNSTLFLWILEHLWTKNNSWKHLFHYKKFSSKDLIITSYLPFGRIQLRLSASSCLSIIKCEEQIHTKKTCQYNS